jgi:hypothetical protein
VLDKKESILLIRLNLDPRIIFLGRAILRGLLLLLLLSLSAVLFFAFCMSGYIAFLFSETIRVPLSVRGAVVTGVSCGVKVSPWSWADISIYTFSASLIRASYVLVSGTTFLSFTRGLVGQYLYPARYGL